jgi:hypothetical protein
MDGLFRRGWIHDPKGKAKSVVLTAEGHARALDLLDRFFGSRASKPQEAANRDQRNRES